MDGKQITEKQHSSDKPGGTLESKQGNVQQQKIIMNKSTVFWFEFFSKRFGPGPSSVELLYGWHPTEF